MELRLVYQRATYYVPLLILLKALIDETDCFIVKEITRFVQDCQYMKQFVISMLRRNVMVGIHTQRQAKTFLGNRFAAVIALPAGTPVEDIADHVLKKSVLIHLKSNYEKFKLLCFMSAKLFKLSKGELKPDNLDNPAFQEILLSGQIYLMSLKVQMKIFLQSVKAGLTKEAVKKNFNFDIFLGSAKTCTNKASSISPPFRSMIATGNIASSDCEFMSNTGFSILCDRTNILQFLSNLTSVNKFNLQFYTSTMRKFYPESWGFLCPMETPEGLLTGLKNHFTIGCQIMNLNVLPIKAEVLYKRGMLPYHDPYTYYNDMYCIVLDGMIAGWLPRDRSSHFVKNLRFSKGVPESGVPQHTEIVFFPKEKSQFLHPGILIFSTPCRMMRLVQNIKMKKREFIGTFEQPFLKIAVGNDKEFEKVASHKELSNTSFLGLSANSIPFTDHNPGTRNMFTCMKSRQAVGLPFLNANYRSDTKSLHLVYPQSPVIATRIYDEFGFDVYPIGTNAIVAVISYSGFDMEDAVVINQASVERGLMMDVVLKTVFYDLKEIADKRGCKTSSLRFQSDPNDPEVHKYLDTDGFPHIGGKINIGDPVCSVLLSDSAVYHLESYNGKDTAKVENVRICKNPENPEYCWKISITFSVKRNVQVGDKFTNRHGQKGICSTLLPIEDMPFTSDGMTPDILFNPHGLPSRMSIGMMLEIMAGKIGCLEGVKYGYEPFLSKVDKSKCLGEELKKYGFDFYGTEKFYSGISGEELEADVFFGVIYYQRLYHIVEEKYQVRSVCEIDSLTGQPLKTAKSGAIRFGEMERDAILSHGAAFLVQDRLLLNSDACTAYICSGCSCLLYPVLQSHIPEEKDIKLSKNDKCKICNSSAKVFKVIIPYVLVYLLAELAVFNIKVKLRQKLL